MSSEIDYVLERWDQTDPELQRKIAHKFAERATKFGLIISELHKFVGEKLEYAERMEELAINGNHNRETARNNGKATAYECVLNKLRELQE